MRRCDNKVISGKTAQFNNCAVYFACLSRLFVPAVFSAVFCNRLLISRL